jgi:hypothetical protein
MHPIHQQFLQTLPMCGMAICCLFQIALSMKRFTLPVLQIATSQRAYILAYKQVNMYCWMQKASSPVDGTKATQSKNP